jgi:hypothetical protein
MDISTWGLFANIFVSSIGLGFFLYGRKQRRWPQLLTGLILMSYPYFVSGAFTMLAIGAGLLAALWIGLRLGL